MRGQRLVWLLLGLGAFFVFYANLDADALRTSSDAANTAPGGPQAPQTAALVALAEEAKGLRTPAGSQDGGDKMDRPGVQPAQEAPLELTGSGEASDGAEPGNDDPNDWCDELIPRYDIREWETKHGGKVPDHPAVFTGAGTKEDQIFHDLQAFLAAHGDHEVTALPEYAQAGGHLAYIGIDVVGEATARLKELAKDWNNTHLYYNDFRCSSLCKKIVAMFGTPKLFQAPSTVSTNFLIGGPESGLPFHKHTKTWQGLSVGRKAWYVVPPGSMSEAMHDATGPYIFPVRSYHRAMQRLPVGQRPLYCVQHPGEIFYIPDFWWHSTMNLDSFQLAYGAKPCCLRELHKTEQHSAVMEHYPQQKFDHDTSGGFGWESPMPYSIIPRVKDFERACKGEDRPAGGLDDPLRRISEGAARAVSQQEDKGLSDTAAFAHCVLAKKVHTVLKQGCVLSENIRQGMSSCIQQWRDVAANLSSSVARKECVLKS